MIHLDLVDVVAVACECVGGTPQDVLEVVDSDDLDRVLSLARRPPQGAGREPSTQLSAAVLLHELARGRVLPSGNQRLAVLVMLQFLAVNGLVVDLGPPGSVRRMLAAVTSGSVTVAQTVAWLDGLTQPAATRRTGSSSIAERLRQAGSGPAARAGDPLLADLRRRLHHHLIQTLGPVLSDGHVGDLELRRRVEDELRCALAREGMRLSPSDADRVVRDVTDDVAGYGPIDRHLKDPDVSEVMVNGPEDVYVERFGKLEKVDTSFVDVAHLRRIIDKIVSRVGRRVDESQPMVDARLPDGSRVNAVVHPIALGGPFLTVRKFAADPFTVDDLVEVGTLTERVARFLDACVKSRVNVVVSGGTGTGKTTLLNVLSSFIPAAERIITIEDAKELQLRQPHVVCLEARPANVEGRGQVEIRDLVRNALRMRPDRIVIGECRAGEALDMLQAMNTGHDGSLTTIHSNSPRDTLSRIETMTLTAGFDLPLRAIREQMASALHLVVHLSRFRDGSRRVTHVTEVQGMEGDTIVMQDVFRFDSAAGADERGRPRGRVRATGMRPKFTGRLGDAGATLPPELFT